MVGAEFVIMTKPVDKEFIRSALLDRDGACRDFNLSEFISFAACLELIKVICRDWYLSSSHSSEGNSIPMESIINYLSESDGAIQLIFISQTRLPSHLQLFLSFSESHYFSELTFFPDDLDKPNFDLDDFLRFLGSLIKATNSNQYYLRHENAAWRHGSDDEYNSVIFSYENFSLKV